MLHLASRSPRRSELLARLGVAFGVLDLDIPEQRQPGEAAEEYVRGDAYTNTIEGVFSIFKRGMKGVYQHCSEKHLHRYLAEFDFRYNNRIALGIDDQSRAANALASVKGKRLTYKASAGVAAK